MEQYLLISDAAKEVRVESHVLRYWEEELHLPIKRNELGHRYYTEEDVERFKQIKGMKERGLQLKAIKMILKDGRLDVLSGFPTGQETMRNTAPSGRSGEFVERETGRTEAASLETDSETESETVTEIQEGKRGLAIDIVPGRNQGREIAPESKEDKSRRLQWLLQQLIRQTLQENNGQLCREIRESVVKELDYQFRMQEEREEARDKMLAERDEEHYKKMDELLRKKSRRLKKEKRDKGREVQSWNPENQSLDSKVQDRDLKVQTLDPKVQGWNPENQSRSPENQSPDLKKRNREQEAAAQKREKNRKDSQETSVDKKREKNTDTKKRRFF